MANLVIREAVNAAIFGLFLCLAWRFWRIWRDAKGSELRFAAISLCLLFVGEAFRSSLAWLSLASTNSKWPDHLTILVRATSPIWFIALALIMIGGLLCIRAFPIGEPAKNITIALVISLFFMSLSLLT